MTNETILPQSWNTSSLQKELTVAIAQVAKSSKTVFPKPNDLLKAFTLCSVDHLKVVVIGQDPYHDGSATGLAFDNLKTKKSLSGSLRNILKEIEEIPGRTEPNNAESILEHLPPQGVLLLNTALTVEEGIPAAHTDIWKRFTEEVIKHINQKDNIVWLLLGNYAKAYEGFITNPTHKVVKGTHPSPLSASRGFFGSKVFCKVNEALASLNHSLISW